MSTFGEFDGERYIQTNKDGSKSIIKKDESNNLEFYNEEGQLHREDGPAVIYPNKKKRMVY